MANHVRLPAKKRKLTPREVKFVKAKVAGKSNTQAALEATGATSYGSAQKMGNRLSTNVNVMDAVHAEMKKQGITIEQVVAPVRRALTAQKTVILGNGDDAFADVVDDIPTQLKGVQFASQWLGFKQPDGGTTNYNFINVATEQKDEFGL